MSYNPAVNSETLELFLGICATGQCTASSTSLTKISFGTPYFPVAGGLEASDVGLPIAISGGGPINALMPATNQVQGGLFVTTIATVVSATECTLTDAPDTSYYNSGFANIVIYRPCPFASDVATLPTNGLQFQYSASIAPGTADTLQFTVLNSLGGNLGTENPYVQQNGAPQLGQPVYLHSSDSAVGDIFGGYIDSLTTSSMPGVVGEYSWSMQCASWTGLAKRRVVPPATPQVFTAVDGDIVFSSIVLDYLVDDGVSVTVPSGLPEITLACPVGANIGQLLDQVVSALSTEDIAYYWNTDPWRGFVLATRGTVAAPWSVTDGEDLFAGDSPYSQSFVQTHNQQANMVYAIGAAVLINTLNATYSGNGSATTFNLPQPAGAAPTITLNSNPQTVGVLGVDSGDDWYWSQGSNVLTQDSGGAVLVSTDVLAVSYTPETPGIAQSPNVAALQKQQALEGTSAEYDASFNVSQPILPDDLLDLATAYEIEYGSPATTCQFYTLRPGLAVGQLQSIELSDAGVPNGDYLIATVQMTLFQNVILWQYTAFGGANIGDAITALTQFINRQQGVGTIVTPTVPIMGAPIPQTSGNFASGLAGTGLSSPLPFPQTVTKGNLLAVVVTRNNLGATTVTDTLGNTYALAIAAANAGPFANVAGIFWAISIASGPNSVTCGAANYIAIAEIGGINPLSPVDTTGSHSGTAPTITVANENNVVVTGMCMDSSSFVPTATAPEIVYGYSLLGGPASDCAGALEVVPSAGAFTSSLVSAASDPIYVSASFNRAVATAPPPQTTTVVGNPSGGVNVTTKGDLQGFSTLPDRVPVGADGDVLTADSTNALGVSWQSGGVGSGALTLLESHSATNAAAIDFTAWYGAGYSEYKIILEGIVAVSSSSDIGLQMSTNGGSSYDTGSNYAWDNWAFTPAGTGNNGSNSDTLLVLLVSLTTVTDTVGSGEYSLFNPGSGAAFKNLVGNGFCLSANDGRMTEGVACAASYLNTSAVNAFRVIARSGNITGTVRVYGLAN